MAATRPVPNRPFELGFRVLELGDAGAMFCGKLLGDLGCDVIRIEHPNGDELRSERPLVEWAGEQVSAAWLAYNTSKRSLALDIASPEARDALSRLIDACDAVVVSGSVAWLQDNGLLPEQMRANRKRLVVAAITPFGLEGPYAGYATSDLVAQSAGGFVFTNGDEDRPPVRISEEQTWAQVGSQTAFVLLAALHAVARDGLGESIDMSIQEAVVSTLLSIAPAWQFGRVIPSRHRLALVGRSIQVRDIWPCKDGFVTFRLSFGQNVGMRNIRLTEWMEESGMAGELVTVPWDYLSTLELDQRDVDRWQAIVQAFFGERTKQELYAGALERQIMLFPVLELPELLDNEQLRARGFFREWDVPGAGRTVRWPGPFFRTNVDGVCPEPAPPPALGGDTRSVLESLAGLETMTVERLEQAGVVRCATSSSKERQAEAPASNFKLRTSSFQLPTSNFKLPPTLLSGVTVADFGWAIAGPALGRYLAHLGATVIKIESRTRLDRTRASPPFVGKPQRNRSAIFDRHNAGKLSVALDLKHPVGLAIARRLALWADMVSENFRPGVMDDFGLDFASLSAERTDLVMLSASMQGQTGPHRGHPGLGVTLQGIVGLCHLTGWPDRDPAGPSEAYTDTLAPWLAGTALLAALHRRRMTGEGAHVDLSQLESTVEFLAPAMLHEQLTGVHHTRQGNASAARAPEGVYPCAGDDRWCAISACNDDQWTALAATVGFDARVLAVEQDLDWRLAATETIDAAIAHWTASREAEAVRRLLQSRGVPAYLVATSRDLFSDPQLAARGHFVERDHPAMGVHLYEQPPYRLAEHEVMVERSPLLGEQTDEVLASCLSMSAEEIAAARESGALE